MGDLTPQELSARIDELMDLIGREIGEGDPEHFISGLEAHAHSIGMLCQNWAHLEAAIRHLLRVAAGLPNSEASELILRCFEFRDQLNAIKVAVVSAKHPTPLVDEAIATINYIDNTLRPRRNRLVHDLWIEKDGDPIPTRMVVAPKIKRPQSRQRPIVHVEMQPDDLTEVLTTATTTAKHVAFVKRLADALERPTRGRIARLLAERIERPLFLPPQEKPRPTGTPKRARAPQLRPSQG